MGLCFTQEEKKEKENLPADCASPGAHTRSLHQSWQSGRGQLSQRSYVKLTCLCFLFFLVVSQKNGMSEGGKG